MIKRFRAWSGSYTPTFKMLVLLVLLVAATMTAVGYLVISFGSVSKDTNEIVKTIEDQTSPEAQERTKEAINGIIFRVNCGTREAFEDAIDGLIKQNPGILRGTITITDNCPKEKP